MTELFVFRDELLLRVAGSRKEKQEARKEKQDSRKEKQSRSKSLRQTLCVSAFTEREAGNRRISIPGAPYRRSQDQKMSGTD